MWKAKNKVALLIKCVCATFFLQSVASVQTVSEFIQSWRSQGQAVVLLSEQETNMAPYSRGITQTWGSASWKQGPIVIWVRREGWRRCQSCEVTGGWRSGRGRWRWGTLCGGYSGLRYGASTAAPHSPWTNACSPWTPSEETPAAWPALWTAACVHQHNTQVRNNRQHKCLHKYKISACQLKFSPTVY